MPTLPFDINEFLRDVGALGALVFAIWNILRSLRAATQDRMYAHYTEICKLFMQKPNLCPYFYDRKILSESNAGALTLRAEIDIMSEAIFGLIEHAVLQRKHMPSDSWRHCWLPYTKERLATSEELNAFYNQNKEWYTKKLRKIIDKIRTGK